MGDKSERVNINRDEVFKKFIDEFGEATGALTVPAASIKKWKQILPSQLLKYWQLEGWGCYANGLLWIVNPDDYTDIVNSWLTGTRLKEIDSFYVIARSAFGGLYLCGENTGRSVSVTCVANAITAMQKELQLKTAVLRDISIQSFFLSQRDRFDIEDEYREPLFERVLKQLGALAPDELYGFEPTIITGGRPLLENLRKLKLHQHLTALRQLAEPTIISDMGIEG